MIAGVVATLTDDARHVQSALDAISARPEIELGDYAHNGRRIPLTIDSLDRREVESATQWLQSRPEIAFVDVVFVHLEDSEGVARQGDLSRNALTAAPRTQESDSDE